MRLPTYGTEGTPMTDASKTGIQWPAAPKPEDMRFAFIPGGVVLERHWESGEWRPAEPKPAAGHLQGYIEWDPFEGATDYYLEAAGVPDGVFHVQAHQQRWSACFWLGEAGEAERWDDDDE
jgi:hypothetical protein